MPIYTYDCPEDGTTDVFFRAVGPPFELDCPECRGKMQNCVTAPAQVNIQRDWNEKANDCRRNPYDQAKAQLHNLDRENQEHQGTRPMEITEEMLQVTAREIDKENKKPDDPLALPKRAQQMKKKAQKQKQEL